MRLSNLTFAAGPDGLAPAVARLEDALGVSFRDGGFHPRFGTRNNILAVDGGRYLEVVEVLEHPAAEKAVFGQAVRARSELGGGWIRTGEVSQREYVRLAMSAPELGGRTLYANLGRAAGQDDDDAFAVIWNPGD